MAFIISSVSIWTIKWQNVYVFGVLTALLLPLCCFVYDLFTCVSASVSACVRTCVPDLVYS